MFRIRRSLVVLKALTLFLIFLFTIINIKNAIAQNVPTSSKKNLNTSGTRKIRFSGCDWYVKSGFYGPGPNHWSDSEESVWLDEKGRLHMKIRFIDGKWYCPEIYSEEFTGYGEHRFLIEGDLNSFDKNIVLGLFTYASDEKEIDIEFSNWGNANYTDIGSFTIQPYTIQGNSVSYKVNSDSLRSTHYFNWQPNYVLFGSIAGHHEGLLPTPDLFYHQWIYWGDHIPKNTDNLRTHINFWLFQGRAPIRVTNLEIIISRVMQPISSNVNQGEKKIKNYLLIDNYPNPFSDFTKIGFQLPSPDFIRIDVFNILGKKIDTVFNSYCTENFQQIIFNGTNLASGVYFYRINGSNFSQTKKMVKTK